MTTTTEITRQNGRRTLAVHDERRNLLGYLREITVDGMLATFGKDYQPLGNLHIADDIEDGIAILTRNETPVTITVRTIDMYATDPDYIAIDADDARNEARRRRTFRKEVDIKFEDEFETTWENY